MTFDVILLGESPRIVSRAFVGLCARPTNSDPPSKLTNATRLPVVDAEGLIGRLTAIAFDADHVRVISKTTTPH